MLTPEDKDLIAELQAELRRTSRTDLLMWRYYRLQQRLEHLGMAIPPAMRRFLVISNWCRVAVDVPVARQQLRAMILPGEEEADPTLRAIADANNLDSHIRMFSRDAKIFGRSFMSIGTNEDSPELPLMRVEPPRAMAALVDIRTERMRAAARFYTAKNRLTASMLTLYLPGETKHVERGKNGWEQVGDTEEHDYDVPVVMHLNRRISGEWDGESQLTDMIPLVDAAGRSMTDMQFAQEAHGVPGLWATGVTQKDFVDDKGEPIPQFEAYFDVIKMLSSEGAKWGQFTAADLKNFETALRVYGQQASIVTGFPARYFGITSANPPTEGSIRAEEAQLVRAVEMDNADLGMVLGWAGALAYQFATADEVKGNRVKLDWFDPGTPTTAQLMDAVVKAKASGILSREGSWDELGWSEARKSRERGYFEREASADPELNLARALADGTV